MDQPPLILARHRIDVAMPQIPFLVGIFQILDLLRILLHRDHIKLNGPFILLPAIDQQLFLIAFTLKRHPRQLRIKIQRHNGRHQKHKQQRKSFFLTWPPAPGPWPLASHVFNSATNGSVC